MRLFATTVIDDRDRQYIYLAVAENQEKAEKKILQEQNGRVRECKEIFHQIDNGEIIGLDEKNEAVLMLFRDDLD